jgi:hypothetical protein
MQPRAGQLPALSQRVHADSPLAQSSAPKVFRSTLRRSPRSVHNIRCYISRFGQYTLDLSRTPPPVEYELPILSTLTAK